MRLIEGIYFGVLIFLGILTSKSDLKEGHIYNKVLAGVAIIAMLLGCLYYGYFERNLAISFLANMLLLATLSLLLFFTHSFAGGDCKLAIVMGGLYPANFYVVYRHSTMTLIFSLGIAILCGYIYLLLSSLYDLLRKKNKISKQYVSAYLSSFGKSFISATVYISTINLCVFVFGKAGIYFNSWIVRLLCIATAWLVGRSTYLKKWYILVTVFGIDIIAGCIVKMLPFSLNPENYVLVIVLLLCQLTIRTNLYEEVAIDNLKKGMILSTVSSIVMQNSRVRGLPSISTEDLKSRLSDTEVNSIKRWADGNKITSITIVKKIPFAIFIFFGFAGYFVIWSITR